MNITNFMQYSSNRLAIVKLPHSSFDTFYRFDGSAQHFSSATEFLQIAKGFSVSLTTSANKNHKHIGEYHI